MQLLPLNLVRDFVITMRNIKWIVVVALLISIMAAVTLIIIVSGRFATPSGTNVLSHPKPLDTATSPFANSSLPVVDVWLNEDINKTKQLSWTKSDPHDYGEATIAGLAKVRVHFPNQLVYESVSSISFFQERHGKIASADLAPPTSTWSFDEALSVVRNVGKSLNRPDYIEASIKKWEKSMFDLKLKNMDYPINHSDRLTLSDGSDVFYEIKPYGTSDEWYVSLEITSGAFLDDVNGVKRE